MTPLDHARELQLDRARELRTLRDENDSLRRKLQSLLTAPFSGAYGFITTSVCIELDHPRRWEGADRCVCTRMSYPPEEDVT